MLKVNTHSSMQENWNTCPLGYDNNGCVVAPSRMRTHIHTCSSKIIRSSLFVDLFPQTMFKPSAYFLNLRPLLLFTRTVIHPTFKAMGRLFQQNTLPSK